MNDFTLPLGGLSSVRGKSVEALFDGGMLSSNAGVLALAEVEKRLQVADRLARCIDEATINSAATFLYAASVMVLVRRLARQS